MTTTVFFATLPWKNLLSISSWPSHFQDHVCTTLGLVILSSLLIRLEPWFSLQNSYLFHGDYCHDVLVHRDHPKRCNFPACATLSSSLQGSLSKGICWSYTQSKTKLSTFVCSMARSLCVTLQKKHFFLCLLIHVVRTLSFLIKAK